MECSDLRSMHQDQNLTCVFLQDYMGHFRSNNGGAVLSVKSDEKFTHDDGPGENSKAGNKDQLFARGVRPDVLAPAVKCEQAPAQSRTGHKYIYICRKACCYCEDLALLKSSDSSETAGERVSIHSALTCCASFLCVQQSYMSSPPPKELDYDRR